MNFKKIIVGITLPFFLSSLLLSQSVVELAKKEKERREKLKGKKEIVVTNADLGKLKKRPALTTSRPVFYRDQTGRLATPSEKPSPEKKAQPSEVEGIDRREPREETPEELEAKWNKAKEMVVLWTTRLNGLWHEFYNMNSMRSKETIQQEIAQTSQKLEQAKRDEANAKRNYDRSLIRKKRIP